MSGIEVDASANLSDMPVEMLYANYVETCRNLSELQIEQVETQSGPFESSVMNSAREFFEALNA